MTMFTMLDQPIDTLWFHSSLHLRAAQVKIHDKNFCSSKFSVLNHTECFICGSSVFASTYTLCPGYPVSGLFLFRKHGPGRPYLIGINTHIILCYESDVDVYIRVSKYIDLGWIDVTLLKNRQLYTAKTNLRKIKK